MTHPDDTHATHQVPDNWIACHDCDLLLERQAAPVGVKAVCPRCSHVLYQPRERSIERTLALAVTGLLLFFPANLLPVMSLRVLGMEQSTTIYEGALTLFQGKLYITAVLIFIASILVPLTKILLLLYVSGSLYLERISRGASYAMRYYHVLDEWGMLEVYMLGILVSVVKLKGMATVIPDTGLYCFVALLLVTTLMSALMDEDEFWRRIEHGLNRT